MNQSQKLSFSEEDLHSLKNYLHKVIAVFSANHIGLWIYDVNTEELSYLNDFSRVLGLDRIGLDESSLKTLTGYVYPEDLPAFKAVFDKVIRTKGASDSAKYRCVSPQGVTLWLEDHFLYVENAQDIPQIIGYTANIDHIHTKEEAIRQLQIRYKALAEAMPGFSFVFDDRFFLREVFMPDHMQLFHSMKELVGMDARLIYTPEVSELLIENIHGCLKDGKLREIEYPVYLKDLCFHYQARIVPYHDNMVLAFIQDISDRIRRVEELVEARKRDEANQIKSAFLANMSHEIRTPLNAIVGFSEILMEEENNESKQEFMSIIRKNSDLLLQLINDILDISRIESGKIEINILHTELHSLAREVEEIHRIKIEPGVNLVADYPEGELWTYTDPNRIKQVLYNFLSNAIKHTDEGQITLTLTHEDDDSVVFSVSDTGHGIEEDKIGSVFDRFEKLNNFVQGTGLGLAISKSLVEQLGGRIWASSVFGEGSTFSFHLPLYHTKEEALLAQQTPTPQQEKDLVKGIKKNISVIEPQDEAYKNLETVLSQDFTLTRFKEGEEMLNRIHHRKPNLVLIDVTALGEDGFSIIKKIKSHFAELPVIALANQGNYDVQGKAIKAGSNDIVLIPYSASRIQDAVVAHIK